MHELSSSWISSGARSSVILRSQNFLEVLARMPARWVRHVNAEGFGAVRVSPNITPAHGMLMRALARQSGCMVPHAMYAIDM